MQAAQDKFLTLKNNYWKTLARYFKKKIKLKVF